MIKIIVKELLWSIILSGMAAAIVYYETDHLPRNWFFLSSFIVIIFPTETLVLSWAKAISSQAPGWLLMGLSAFKMVFIPILVILLFDREHEATPAVIIPTIVAYLILLGLDTYWKIKWLFGKP